MNLEFIRSLQAIAEVEKNPHFRSKKYVVVDKENLQVDHASGAVPVVLKHPDNVIVVASPTGKAPPPTVGERRVTQLSKALKMAADSFSRGSRGCSIVVHEGMYIGVTSSGIRINGEDSTYGVSLEIVGTGEVRIIHKTAQEVLFDVRRAQLTLKNLAIYASPLTPIPSDDRLATIKAVAAKICLVDVRMHGSNFVAFNGVSINLRVIDCAISHFNYGFALRKADSEFQNCRWSMITPAVAIYKGKATFSKCQFHIEDVADSVTATIFAAEGGEIFMTETLMSGFNAAIFVRDSYSRVVVDRCKFLDCYYVVEAFLNSSASIIDCEMSTYFVLALQLNEEGKVEFRRNSVKPRQSSHLHTKDLAADATAFIITDREPKVLKHDFGRVKYICRNILTKALDFSIGATRESRLEYERRCKDLDYLPKSQRLDPKMKRCLKCRHTEQDEPDAKFQYCSKCRNVCYCSKECQKAHWRDHKLLCNSHD